MFLGTDPEFIIEDANKEAVPAWKLFPDKENKIVPTVGGYGLFRDGFAVELNVPPSNCREELARAIIWALNDARKRLPEGYRLVSKPTVRVDPLLLLQDAPADALVFGCDPSWNAYTGEFASAPLDATEHPRRYAGGHMHIAWYKKHIDAGGSSFEWVKDPQQVMRFVQLLDRFVGLPLSVWFHKPETFERRQYYGQAGDFRFQNYGGQWYGVEYRTPGPEIWNTPLPASFAFGVMRSVAKSFLALTKSFDEGLARDIRKAVDTGDGAEALLPQCYIEVDRSYSTKARFLDIVGKQRPFQELVAIPDLTIGHQQDPALIGWGNWDLGYDFTRSR